MPTSDDISGLFLPARSSDPATQAFRQATVLTFDPVTGANTLSLAGATLTNTPLLNIGDTVNLKVGDAVILGKMNGAMFILGRVIPAGNASLTGNIVSTAVSEGTSAAGFATTTSLLAYSITIPSFTIPVWCNHVDVLCVASATVNNTSATKTLLTVAAQAGASIGPEQFTNVPAGDYGCITTSHSAVASGGGLGGTTFNCATLVKSSVAYTLTANNLAQTTAFVTYTRV